MIEEDFKNHSRIRRQKKLEKVRDGWEYFDRTVPSGREYQRHLKYRPQDAVEWEDLED